MEVVHHIAKLYWFGVDQMRVERTVKLSIYRGARQRVRKVDRSSVVVGEDLSTRDGKVKVSAKKNTCIRTDQKSCEKSCEGTEMASASPPRCFSATFFFTRFMTIMLLIRKDQLIENLARGFTQ